MSRGDDWAGPDARALGPLSATQFWRNKVLEVAKDFPEYTFAVADEEDFATELKDLGLSESGEEVNAAILDEGGRRFAMEPDDFDADALRDFVTAFKKGGPAPHPPTPAPSFCSPCQLAFGTQACASPGTQGCTAGEGENPCSFAPFSLSFCNRNGCLRISENLILKIKVQQISFLYVGNLLWPRMQRPPDLIEHVAQGPHCPRWVGRPPCPSCLLSLLPPPPPQASSLPTALLVTPLYWQPLL